MPENDRVPEYLNPFHQIAQAEQKKFSDRVAEICAPLEATIAEQKVVNDDLAYRVGTFMAERDEARRFAEDAAQKYNELLAEKRVLRCAFCSFEYPDGTPPTQHDALTQHIRECQSHPYRMEVAGLRWEVSHCREMLRHLVAVAYKGTLSNEMELVLVSVNNYLAGAPQTEVES